MWRENRLILLSIWILLQITIWMLLPRDASKYPGESSTIYKKNKDNNYLAYHTYRLANKAVTCSVLVLQNEMLKETDFNHTALSGERGHPYFPKRSILKNNEHNQTNDIELNIRNNLNVGNKDVYKNDSKNSQNVNQHEESKIKLSQTNADENMDRNLSKQKKIYLVVYWTVMPNPMPPEPVESLTTDDVKCVFSTDRHLVNRADYVIFPLKGIWRLPFPRVKKRHRQRWVLLTQESPMNEISDENWLNRYDKVFNFTAHYHSKADIHIPYGYCGYGATESNTSVISENMFRDKTGLVTWVVSNCATDTMREKYVQELATHINVDIYGRCGSLKAPGDLNVILKKYKFYLAFENSFCDQYVTEKIFRLLFQPDMYVIPVVLGLGPYDSIIPRGSYIDVSDFKSPSSLANYMERVADNHTLFMEYFTWRDEQHCSPIPDDKPGGLCPHLHQLAHTNNIVYKQELMQIFGKQNCVSAKKYYENILINFKLQT